jgi:SAM-dependent methyltransferase
VLYEKLRRLAHRIRGTPLHPQWFAYRGMRRLDNFVATVARGTVLDIGCSDKRLRTLISSACHYVGLDYPSTAKTMYRTQPDLFGDAHSLPLRDNSVATVVLLEVLEHLRNPEAAVAEALRVLQPDGSMILSVPFMYPIHDAPHDFQRWTAFGLRELTSKLGATIVRDGFEGQPTETAALIGNIGLARLALTLAERRNPFAVLVLLVLPVLVLTNNILGWALSFLTPKDGLMPYRYYVLVGKTPV